MDHKTHGDHEHKHGSDCSHATIRHADHVDYLDEGHLHSVHGDHVDEHVLEASRENPDECTGDHPCGGHEARHGHGQGCGHETVPHAGHVDYLVAGHLHNSHDSHCDNHGAVSGR